MVKRGTMERWQERWNGELKGRSYYAVQKSVGMKRVSLGNDEVRMSRLRFDHTGLNKTMCMFGKVPSSDCPVCNVTEDVEHVPMSCSRFIPEGEQLKGALSLSILPRSGALLFCFDSEMCVDH